MKRFLSAVALLGLLCLRGNGEELRVGTWNLQNYLLQNRFLNGAYRFDYPKPEEQKKGIRSVLARTRPDVLFLQEIGSEAFLRELQLDLAALGLVYPYRHCSRIEDSRSGLAVLSRIPLQSVIFHRPLLSSANGEESHSLRRGIQEVRLSFAGRPLTFFHVHLKSRFSRIADDPEAVRARSLEITTLSAFLATLRPAHRDSPTFLVGDFNTPFPSPLLNPLKDHGFPVVALDPHRQSWTYSYWRTHETERLDGFWFLNSSGPLLPFHARISPSPDPAPSDHRLVLLDVFTANPS